MSAKPVQTHKSPTAADIKAELISKSLRAKAESLFMNFSRFDNIQALGEAAEWQTLNRLFSDAAKDYAMVSHTERDRVAWVRDKIRFDRYAMAEQNAARVFRIKQLGRANVGIEHVRRVCDEKLDFAMTEGMRKAAVDIAESEIPHRNRRPAAKNAKERRDDPNLVAARIAKKLSDPVGNPTMTVEQVASAFSVSKSTIYRWIDTGRKQGPEGIQLTWATHGKISTGLVRRALPQT